MMEFISDVWRIYAAHDLTVLVRFAVYIDDDQSVRLSAPVGI
jgi:hypothetical protein